MQNHCRFHICLLQDKELQDELFAHWGQLASTSHSLTEKQLFCQDRLGDMGLFSQEKRRLQRDLRAAFQYLKGPYGRAGERHFTRAFKHRTRNDSFNLKEARFRLGTRRKFFTLRVMRHWKTQIA